MDWWIHSVEAGRREVEGSRKGSGAVEAPRHSWNTIQLRLNVR